MKILVCDICGNEDATTGEWSLTGNTTVEGKIAPMQLVVRLSVAPVDTSAEKDICSACTEKAVLQVIDATNHVENALPGA